MDYFEALVTTLLEHEGYWVRQSFKVNLTKVEKRSVGKPSIPRPEVDIVAFKPVTGVVLAQEVKSYLDSAGVRLEALKEQHDEPEGRYKLFTSATYREAVLGRLKSDLEAAGMIQQGTTVRLGLVAGNVYQNKAEEIRSFLSAKGWFFWSPDDIKSRLKAMAEAGYENDPSVIAAKILER